MATVSYPQQALKLKGNQIRVPLGNTCKCWFRLDSFLIHKPSNLKFSSLKELRILPKNKRIFLWSAKERRSKVHLSRCLVSG